MLSHFANLGHIGMTIYKEFTDLNRKNNNNTLRLSKVIEYSISQESIFQQKEWDIRQMCICAPQFVCLMLASYFHL